MASSMADMCTMGGSDLDGGMRMSAIEDIASHPDNKLPGPGFGPSMVHGTGMAGQDIGVKNPWSMEQMR